MENEIFIDLPTYEGLYQISNYGRIKSFYKNKILNGYISDTGYLRINLYKNKKLKTIKVHQLVAMAFLGHKPNGFILVVDHIDNNPLNNNVENLQLVSNRVNTSKDKKNKTSKHTGVCFKNANKKWLANIRKDGKKIHLGYFNCETKAFLAYQLALKNTL
jgi:hypothetical protein